MSTSLIQYNPIHDEILFIRSNAEDKVSAPILTCTDIDEFGNFNEDCYQSCEWEMKDNWKTYQRESCGQPSIAPIHANKEVLPQITVNVAYLRTDPKVNVISCLRPVEVEAILNNSDEFNDIRNLKWNIEVVSDSPLHKLENVKIKGDTTQEMHGDSNTIQFRIQLTNLNFKTFKAYIRFKVYIIGYESNFAVSEPLKCITKIKRTHKFGNQDNLQDLSTTELIKIIRNLQKNQKQLQQTISFLRKNNREQANNALSTVAKPTNQHSSSSSLANLMVIESQQQAQVWTELKNDTQLMDTSFPFMFT